MCTYIIHVKKLFRQSELSKQNIFSAEREIE